MDGKKSIVETFGDKGYIYHYCPLEAFKSIIEKPELWLSSATYSNDRQELRVAKEIATNMRSNKSINTPPEHSIYIVCFSKKADLLSQWRGYGNDGIGVSIGFDPSVLKKEKKLEETNPPYIGSKYNGFYCMVNYDTESVADLVEKSSRKNNLAMEDILINAEMCCYKNKSFEEESEVRIVYIPDNKGNTDISLECESIEFKISNRRIVPYIKMSIPKESIKEIILGPKNNMTENDMYLFLRKNGYNDVEVIKSSIPYC